MDFLTKLQNVDDKDIKKIFQEILEEYINPAFGSMSKRDFDILLFMKLQKLGVIDKNPEIYELVSELRVTRTKARNLLYEAKLRSTTNIELDKELKKLIETPIFLIENEKIGLEVDNPYLIDHLRYELKKLKYITDGSFSPELVKLSLDAYIALVDKYLGDNLNEEKRDKITKKLIEKKLISDTSFKGVLKGVMKKLGEKVADKAGAQVATSIVDYVSPIFTGTIDSAVKTISEILNENKE